jgi:hypothetical protein
MIPRCPRIVASTPGVERVNAPMVVAVPVWVTTPTVIKACAFLPRFTPENV